MKTQKSLFYYINGVLIEQVTVPFGDMALYAALEWKNSFDDDVKPACTAYLYNPFSTRNGWLKLLDDDDIWMPLHRHEIPREAFFMIAL